jgi:hypothetical protein
MWRRSGAPWNVFEVEMKARPKGRKGEQEAREEWTARLQRFANARTAKQKQAAIEPALKINPGGALRDMLLAWGYSASARGRKPKGAKTNGQDKTARERLEETLDRLYGAKPTPVRSLYAKLAGRADITVQDACRIVAALMVTWPERLETLEDFSTLEKAAKKAAQLADALTRELLSELSGGRSRMWQKSELNIRVFKLIHQERIGASNFIEQAGKQEGALIVAGARRILIGSDPLDVLQNFHTVTRSFAAPNHKGILIFVFDAAVFEAGKEGINLLYNIGLLSTAIQTFALFSDDYDYREPVQEHTVDWSRWKRLSTRCCVAIRKPTLVDPRSGELLKQDKFDDFIARLQPEHKFTPLGALKGFTRFDSVHVMPRKYPSEFRVDGLSDDLYWDVRIHPVQGKPENLEVEYFVPSTQGNIGASAGKDFFYTKYVDELRRSVSHKYITVEEDLAHVIKMESPGFYYDDAQRALYMAARGRLNSDSGLQHFKNMNAAAALRQVGYEVLPISVMLSLFSRIFYIAAIDTPDP